MINPAISICIPAYRQPQLLQRCLQSIELQTYRDIEVIITDDSPDDAVKEVVTAFNATFPLQYRKNPVALGSPGNWNAGLELARGKYVKTLHQDDWLHTPDALARYMDAFAQHPATDFVFAACLNTKEDGSTTLHAATDKQQQQLQAAPECLLLGNFVGAPSTVMFRREPVIPYDLQMKWLVDIDHYIQLLYRNPRAVYIAEPLLNIGIHAGQVTQAVIHDKVVVIPEHILLLSKLKKDVLKELPYFDFMWRLCRNYNVRSLEELSKLAGELPIPARLKKIIRWQSRFSPGMLRNGLLSKALMVTSFLTAPSQYDKLPLHL